MTEEIKLLIEKDDEDAYHSVSSGDYGYKVSDDALKSWKNTFIYEKDYTDLIPAEKQIKFSWCHINAFCPEPEQNGAKTKIVGSIGKTEKPLKTKHILKNMCGFAYPGELLVIMGSSGAGKTTLLNCMTFRNLKGLTVSGLICINDAPVSQNQLAAQSAYVQQDDLFVGYLTVKEHLIFQAQLRINSNHTYQDRLKRVEEVMIELSLKKCEDCVIGVPGIVKGISGGERKRLALATEFLTNPSLLFCDEPTTGLDSFMSLNVIQMLKDLAKTGRTVITTIHQPSSEVYQLFDKFCLVAEGRTAFLGSTSEAERFFCKFELPYPKHFNPADYYIQLLSIVPGKEETCRKIVNSICDSFQTSSMGRKILSAAKRTVKSVKQMKEDPWTPEQRSINPYKVGCFTQMRALFWRSWLSIIKSPTAINRRFITVLAEASLITIIYFGQLYNQLGITNMDGIFFYFLVSTSYQDVFGVVNTVCCELPLFFKENKDGLYRSDVYYISKVFCVIPISILLSWIKTSMIYFATGLNPEISRFLVALCIGNLICLSAQGAGFIISTIAPSFEMAPSLTSFFVSPLLVLGGIYLNINSIPTYLAWLSDLSWFKFGYEAYMINQWDGVKHIQCKTNTSASSVCIRTGVTVLHKESILVNQFWPSIAALLALIILFRILAFCILLYRSYRLK